ncbi:MAG: polysaccharide deacetylase family protein [Clostridium sp.]
MKKLIGVLIALIIVVFAFGYVYLNKDNNANNNDSNVDTNVGKENEPTVSVGDKEFPDGVELTDENVTIPIMYYHAINPNEENSLILHPDKFREQLKYLLDNGYTPISLSQIYGYMAEGKKIPKKSVMITLDDGYIDNYTLAYPILKELKVPATIFVQTNRIEDGGSLTKDQMREMSQNGIDIMSHTVSHPHLNSLSYENQLKEVTESKKVLEEILGKEVYAISYPFGDYNKETLKVVKEAGYKIAFRTNEKLMSKDNGIFELNRIYSNSKKDFNYFKKSIEKASK